MAKTGGGHRDHAATKRTNHAHAYFTDDEWATVVQAAAAAGLRPGAWVARSAVIESEVATGRRRDDWRAFVELEEELRQGRWLLGNIGGNLNDVARTANSTGELAAETGQVLRLVREIARRMDESLGKVRKVLR